MIDKGLGIYTPLAGEPVPTANEETVAAFPNVLTPLTPSPALPSKEDNEEMDKPLSTHREIKPFHNQLDPYVTIDKENPRHRMACDLRATGMYTIKQIADQVEMTKEYLSNVFRQPWAQEYIAEKMYGKAEQISERVRKKLEGLVMKAVERQEELLDLEIIPEYDGEGNIITAAFPEVVRKTSNDILNRCYGTPKQSIEYTDKDKDLSKLSDAEIAELLATQRSRS